MNIDEIGGGRSSSIATETMHKNASSSHAVTPHNGKPKKDKNHHKTQSSGTHVRNAARRESQQNLDLTGPVSGSHSKHNLAPKVDVKQIVQFFNNFKSNPKLVEKEVKAEQEWQRYLQGKSEKTATVGISQEGLLDQQ